MTDPSRTVCLVTRLAGAPPRRAGRAWDLGETVTDLTEEQMRSVRSDPRYRLEVLRVEVVAEVDTEAQPAEISQAAPKPRRRKP